LDGQFDPPINKLGNCPVGSPPTRGSARRRAGACLGGVAVRRRKSGVRGKGAVGPSPGGSPPVRRRPECLA